MGEGLVAHRFAVAPGFASGMAVLALVPLYVAAAFVISSPGALPSMAFAGRCLLLLP